MKAGRSGQMSASGFRARTALEPVYREIANAVSRAQAGDSDAIRVLYLRYKDNVYGYVLSLVRDQHEADRRLARTMTWDGDRAAVEEIRNRRIA